MLFMLSHGGEDGKIYTEQGDFFTIYDVWDTLSSNQLLRECLKINVFGVIRELVRLISNSFVLIVW
jgi:hypothetical protein